MPRDARDSWDDSDDADTVACPYCGGEIHEDSPRCPICERYISEEDSTPAKPLWIVLGALVCLAILGLWVTFRL